jgi:hypothetical protein
MNVGDVGVMLSGAALLAATAVLLFEVRCWATRRATGGFSRRLEELTALVESAQHEHGKRMRRLERRLDLADRAVGRAEDSAYGSADAVRWLREELAPRLLAAEEAVGIRPVVLDLGDDVEDPVQDDDDDGRRQPAPAGQAGSS